MLPEDFEWAYHFVAQWEGGYVNNPWDNGGETNFGITQETADFHELGPVRKLTPERAKLFYFDVYWKPYASWFLSLTMFDTAVNFGLKGARQFLQEALGFPPAEQDGRIGPVTLARLKAANPDDIARKIAQARIRYRHQRVAESPPQEVFLEGWLNRDTALLKKVTK